MWSCCTMLLQRGKSGELSGAGGRGSTVWGKIPGESEHSIRSDLLLVEIFSTNTEFARPEIPPSAGLFCEVYKRALLQQEEQAVLAVQGWAVKSRWECLDLRDSYVSMQLAVSMSHGVALHHLLVRRGEVLVTHLHMYAEESHNYAKTLHLSERSKVRSYKRRNLQSIHKQAHSITRYPPKKGKVTKGVIR